MSEMHSYTEMEKSALGEVVLLFKEHAEICKICKREIEYYRSKWPQQEEDITFRPCLEGRNILLNLFN